MPETTPSAPPRDIESSTAITMMAEAPKATRAVGLADGAAADGAEAA